MLRTAAICSTTAPCWAGLTGSSRARFGPSFVTTSIIDTVREQAEESLEERPLYDCENALACQPQTESEGQSAPLLFPLRQRRRFYLSFVAEGPLGDD